MNKKLFIQIKNEWRSNLWLAVELLLVSVVMWWITDALYVRLAVYLEPRGFNTEHCYKIEMGELTSKSPDYTRRSYEERSTDILELADRLRHRSDIEAVSLSHNSHPYNGSNGTIGVQLVGDTLETYGRVIRRQVTPDFVRVFQYQGANGETPEQLAEMIERGEILVSDNLFSSTYNRPLPMTNYIGKRFHLNRDTTSSVRLGASLKVVRYGDFQSGSESRSMVYKLDWFDKDQELCVRVLPEHDVDFINKVKADSESQYRVGNIFISEVRSFKDIRRNIQQGTYNAMRNNITIMVFLLVNIFLGLLGTFWFRTQQRRSEIALHKISGATNRDVFIRLVSEGWLLLLIITPLAFLVDYNLAYAELNSWRNGTTLEMDRLLACIGITFLLIALMIVIAIGIPARKAMHIEPADALRDE
ncbi:MAG: FtsX-like permease family protein [Bacteroides sp.]|nr:FtsX-like permease family protein [Bacteroides sp.]